jgi:hypothetical protein
MANDSLTLVLNGEVSLTTYVQALQGLKELIDSLQSEIQPEAKIDWLVDDLEKGSAIATFRGDAVKGKDRKVVEKVVLGFEDVGRWLQNGTQLKHSEHVAKAAQKIVSVIEGPIQSVRFVTEALDADVYKKSGKLGVVTVNQPITPLISRVSHGSVRGKVQTISNRNGLRFTLYDAYDDRPILCFIAPGNEDVMKNAWGKLAIVEGMIRRDATSGKPTTIREIRNVVVLKQSGSYRDAIGAAPRRKRDLLSPEQAIRRMRDAE